VTVFQFIVMWWCGKGLSSNALWRRVTTATMWRVPAVCWLLIYWLVGQSVGRLVIFYVLFTDLRLNMPVQLATHCYHLPSLLHWFTLSFLENLIVHL